MRVRYVKMNATALAASLSKPWANFEKFILTPTHSHSRDSWITYQNSGVSGHWSCTAVVATA